MSDVIYAAADFKPGSTAHCDDGTVWVRAWHYGDPWWVSERWESTPELRSETDGICCLTNALEHEDHHGWEPA